MSSQSVNYRSVLADLKARRDRLNTAISAVEMIIGELSVQSAVPVVAPQETAPAEDDSAARAIPPSANIYQRMTIKDAAVHILTTSGRKLSTGAITRALQEGGIPSKSMNLSRTVYNILSEDAKKEKGGKIVKVGTQWDLRARRQESS